MNEFAGTWWNASFFRLPSAIVSSSSNPPPPWFHSIPPLLTRANDDHHSQHRISREGKYMLPYMVDESPHTPARPDVTHLLVCVSSPPPLFHVSDTEVVKNIRQISCSRGGSNFGDSCVMPPVSASRSSLPNQLLCLMHRWKRGIKSREPTVTRG